MSFARAIGSLALGLLSAFLLATLAACSSAALESADTADAGGVVLVAGATGGTGRALVRNLQAEGYSVRALVRDLDKARLVLGDNVDLRTGDVRDVDTLIPAVTGADYVISAIGASQSDPENGPEAVDYGGVKNLVEAAAAADVRQFVLVSSSGVTQEDHYLNKMFNNVLQWKFKGETALRDSGLNYTIVRPGGLVNIPGGKEALVFAQGDTTSGRISREDVAIICIRALQVTAARNRTFETYSTEAAGQNDWQALFGALQSD